MRHFLGIFENLKQFITCQPRFKSSVRIIDNKFQDWANFCEGKADFDDCDALTLFHEEIDAQELNAALSYFPNSGQIAQRIHAVKAVYPVNRTTWIVDPEMALQIALDDLSERRKAVERWQNDELLSVIEKAKPRFVSDERIFKEAWFNGWNGDLIGTVGDYADECWLDYTKQYYALFEAFYGLTTMFGIEWYLGQPLMNTDLNFGRYFDLWKVGGEYALTDDELVVFQKSPNNS